MRAKQHPLAAGGPRSDRARQISVKASSEQKNSSHRSNKDRSDCDYGQEMKPGTSLPRVSIVTLAETQQIPNIIHKDEDEEDEHPRV